MRNYMEEYQRWLDSPALSNAEWEELNAIRDDKKEIESRFFAPLEFGTAGLRGEMALGCRRMNIHVIRHWSDGAQLPPQHAAAIARNMERRHLQRYPAHGL